MPTLKEMVASALARVPKITCEEYRALKKSGVNHTLIDVREPAEWKAGRIAGAIHIPRGMLEFKIKDAVPNKCSKVIVYCAAGARGALCGEALKKMGYQNVWNLKGGYGQYCAKETPVSRKGSGGKKICTTCKAKKK